MSEPVPNEKVAKTTHTPAPLVDIPVQTPSLGVFDYDALVWQTVELQREKRLVAAVPSGREKDFVLGESGRGGSKLNAKNRLGKTKHLFLNTHYTCYRGQFTRKDQKRKAEAGCDEVQATQARLASQSQPAAPSTQTNAAAARRSRIQAGMSVKQGCLYSFVAKGYKVWEDRVFLLFTPGQTKHVNAAGAAVHGKLADCDCADVGRTLSEECQQWVVVRLLLKVGTKNIIAGMLLTPPAS